MSHWNHRVVKKVWNEGTPVEEITYGVHEVFYNDAGEIYGYTNDPIDLSCESAEALREYLLWCLDALDKPFLEDGKVEFAKDDVENKE